MNDLQLTGQCKTDFDTWLLDKPRNKDSTIRAVDGDPVCWVYHENIFLQLPHSMKYGVYVDFFMCQTPTINLIKLTLDCWEEFEIITINVAQITAVNIANSDYNNANLSQLNKDLQKGLNTPPDKK